jgi:hypothetical protein
VPDAGIVTQLADASGLALAQWSTFNVFPNGYQSTLIPGTLLGRYDARVTAALGSSLARDGDPSSTFITGPFTGAITTYLGNTLRYTTPSSYVVSSGSISSWNFSHDGRNVPDTVPDLAAAMALNPRLRVLSVNGYHDLATPFFVTEQDLARLGPGAKVTLRFYLGGHMTYLDDTARVQQKADLVQFYQSAVAPGSLKIAIAPKSTPPAVTPRLPEARMPAATMEVPLMDPYLPPELAKLAAVLPREDMQTQVTRKIEAAFRAADPDGTGSLTRQQASDAGFGFVAAHFDEIDAARRGAITFDDLKHYLRAQGAQLR